MRELGFENISGTPGTTATLTVTAKTGPAWPRLSDVAPLGCAVHYTIKASDGQVLALGVGYPSAAGTFVRQREYSQFNGTTYTRDPATLASIPAGCTIQCSAGEASIAPTLAKPWNGDAEQWVEPGGNVVTSTTLALTNNRDYFWRIRNLCGFATDAVALDLSAAASIDFGLYEVDRATGAPGKLLLGWQGATGGVGSNVLEYSAATLGVLAKQAQTLSLGDLVCMLNIGTAGNASRTISPFTGIGGSGSARMTDAKPLLYANRTTGTAFGDAPTITGRITTATAGLPATPLRGV